MKCSCSVCGEPARSIQNFSLKPTVSTTRVSLPVTNGVPVITWDEVFWMRLAIGVDDPVGMGSADIEDVDSLEFRNLHHLCTVRRHKLTSATGRLAPRMRLHFVLPSEVEQSFCPRLERRARVGETSATGAPDPFVTRSRTAKSGLAIRPAWSRSRRRSGALPPAATTATTPLAATSLPGLLFRLLCTSRLGRLYCSAALSASAAGLTAACLCQGGCR